MNKEKILKEIEIVFENVEVAKIPANYIKNINFNNSDGTEEVIYVEYDDSDNSDDENMLQHTKYDEDKNLVIKIGEFVKTKYVKKRRK